MNWASSKMWTNLIKTPEIGSIKPKKLLKIAHSKIDDPVPALPLSQSFWLHLVKVSIKKWISNLFQCNEFWSLICRWNRKNNFFEKTNLQKFFKVDHLRR